MTRELKAYCVHCGGGMEFPPEIHGQNIVCPHCQTLTPLGSAMRDTDVITIQATGKSIKLGILISALGFILSAVLGVVINPYCFLGFLIFGTALIVFRFMQWWKHG